MQYAESKLTLHRIELTVFLGWPASERKTAQTVLLDIDFHFPAFLKACETDELTDTICYADLIPQLQTYINAQSYKLLEHLTYDVYQWLHKKIMREAKLQIRITKFPPVATLSGGVSFEYGDK